MITGECNCGAVAYSAKTEITDVYICHCSICRKATGSGNIAVTVIRKDTFTWVRGEDQITHWSKPGHDWHMGFCKVCGSPLPGENDGERLYIPVGTLTSGHENLDVAAHIYTESKAGWEVIGGSAPQFPEGFKPPEN